LFWEIHSRAALQAEKGYTASISGEASTVSVSALSIGRSSSTVIAITCCRLLWNFYGCLCTASDFAFYDYTLSYRWESATELVFIDGQKYVGIIIEADEALVGLLRSLKK
jgi:hypothetical protein